MLGPGGQSRPHGKGGKHVSAFSDKHTLHTLHQDMSQNPGTSSHASATGKTCPDRRNKSLIKKKGKDLDVYPPNINPLSIQSVSNEKIFRTVDEATVWT